MVWISILLNAIILIVVIYNRIQSEKNTRMLKEQLQSVKSTLVDLQKNIQEDSAKKQKEVMDRMEESFTNQKENSQQLVEELSSKITINDEGVTNAIEKLANRIKEKKQQSKTIEKKINSVNDTCEALQNNLSILEELCRLQLVNSLLDDANEAMQNYENR